MSLFLSELFLIDNIPSILSKETIVELFKKFKDGDLNAREKLINHNIKLVVNQVLTFFYDSEYEKNELISIGIFGLIKAVDTFSTEFGNKFSTYAVKCIRNEILQYIRKNKKQKDTCSINEPVSFSDNGNVITYEDILESNIPPVDECIINQETKTLLNKCLEELPENERELLKLYYGFYEEKYTRKELAKMYNVSNSTINKRIKENLEKLKCLLEDNKVKIYSI